MSALNGWQIGLIAAYVLAALGTVAMIGRPRKPVTPGGAAFTLIFTAVLVYAVIRA